MYRSITPFWPISGHIPVTKHVQKMSIAVKYGEFQRISGGEYGHMSAEGAGAFYAPRKDYESALRVPLWSDETSARLTAPARRAGARRRG